MGMHIVLLTGDHSVTFTGELYNHRPPYTDSQDVEGNRRRTADALQRAGDLGQPHGYQLDKSVYPVIRWQTIVQSE